MARFARHRRRGVVLPNGDVKVIARSYKGKVKRKVMGTTPLTRAVKSVLARATETKYVAFNMVNTTTTNLGYVNGALTGDQPNARLFPVIPSIAQGTGTNQRIGNTITPTKFVVHVRYYFDHTYAPAVLAHIRQFFVACKAIKDQSIWIAGAGAASLTQQQNLIDKGDGTNDFANFGTSPENAMGANNPIAHEAWTPLKGGCKTFRIGKQQGIIQGDNTSLLTPYAPGVPCELNVRWSHKLPKLKYEQGGFYPTNTCPLFGALAYLQDSALSYQSLTGVPNVPIGTVPTPVLRFSLRSELHYKDD